MPDRPYRHLWEVQASEPDDRGHANVRRWVVATTMESAMAMVRAEHPGCVFHQALRRNHAYANGSVLIAEDTDG